MKILITVSTYYPRKDGVQKVTQYLAEGLVKKGHSVTVITTNKDVNKENEVYNGVNIKRINLYTRFGFYIGDKKKYRNLILKETKECDVMINVCTQNAFTDVILKNISKYNCKKILYLHGIFDFRFSKVNFSSLTSIVNKLWKEFRWFFYYNLNGKYFKKYDVVSQLHEKDYGNIYFKKKYGIDSVIIENAADEEFFEKTTLPEFVKPYEKYIIFVANYDDRKNQQLAIKEFLKADIDNKIGLVLIGSKKNKYYDKLSKLIIKKKKKLNLSYDEKPIKLLYNVDRKLVSSYVSNAYLYLMTSKWEAYPISLIESMAAKIPFISTNVGVAKYMFGGIVVHRKEDIHYFIEKFCSNEELKNDFGKIGNKIALNNMQIDDKVNLLERICNEKSESNNI